MADFGTVAVIGGTGRLGAAIAGRLAQAGVRVILGSRSPDAARDSAARLGGRASGAGNGEAAAAADILFVAVPFAAQEETLRAIAPHASGKLVIDATVPLMPPRVMRVQLPPEGSAALRAHRLLGSEARLVAGFHNVAADKLAGDGALDCDILLFGDDKDARAEAVELAEAMGLRALHGGPLANAVAAEALTSVLIFLNKTYAAEGAGIRFTGIPG